MSEFDPIEGLVALGVVTREQAEAATRVPLWVSASRVGRLVHAGVDPQELMSALSTLTGIPVASRELVQRAERFLLQPHLVRKMRDLLACPVRRDAGGTVHILLADPDARDEIARHLLNFRVYLAVETEVRGLLEHLWPLGSSMEGSAVLEGDTEPGAPPLSQSQSQPPAPPRLATPMPRAPTPAPRVPTPPPTLPRSVAPPAPLPRAPTPMPKAAPDPFSSFHMNIPSTSPGTLGRGESVLREVAKNVERPFDAPSPPAPQAPPKPLHEPFHLNAPRPSHGKARAAPASDDTVDNTVDNTIDNTIDNVADDIDDQTVRLPAAPAGPPGRAPASSAPPPHRREAIAPPSGAASPQRSFLAGSVLGVVATLLLALLVVGGVLMLRGGDDGEGGALQAKQEALLAEAQKSAAKNDHAWAVAKCDEVLKLDRTTRTAAAALVLRGRERLTLSDREGAEDLREALRLLPVGDALRFQAERALAGAGLDP